MKAYDVAIIGAGAAGMIAAERAAERGKKVILIEKMAQPGMKLRITGKGRCNVGNVSSIDEFSQHCGSDSAFLRPALESFFHEELIAFFEKAGVALVVERGKRIFPKSGKAFDIFKVLINKIERSNIKVLKNSEVRSINIKNNTIEGVSLSNGQKIEATKLILATGGQSYPLTGSTGDGLRFAKELGHTIVPCVPALVGLTVEERIPPGLSGFTVKNIRISCKNSKGEKLTEDISGDMTFGRGCLEGPIILSLSRKIARIVGKEKISLKIDFKPALSALKIENKIERELTQRKEETLRSILRAFAPRELIELFIQALPHSMASKKGKSLSEYERNMIKQLLKNMSFKITGTEGWKRAVITQGGVSLNEIDSKTMESKKVKGLYFAGELMDLDADTGGYNLQIAFSTGFLAGSKV